MFSPALEADARFPVPTWPYRPTYLPNGLAIEIATGTPVEEPEFFYLPFRRAGAVATRDTRHAIPLSRITHVRMGTPAGAPVSPAVRWAEHTGLLSVEPSPAYVLTLTFGETAGEHTADLRPALPLVLHW